MHQLPIVVAAAALAATCLAGELRGQITPAPSPPPAATAPAPLLPPGAGHDTTVRVCSSCHAPEIAAQQRLDAAGWHELVETMAERGAQGSDADFAQITDYLARNFPDQPGKK